MSRVGPSRRSRDWSKGPLSKGNRTTSENREDSRPWGVAQDRSPSLAIRPDRLGGRCIIAPRRSNSAHLHRPWRAIYTKACCQHRGSPKARCRPLSCVEILARPMGGSLGSRLSQCPITFPLCRISTLIALLTRSQVFKNPDLRPGTRRRELNGLAYQAGPMMSPFGRSRRSPENTVH